MPDSSCAHTPNPPPPFPEREEGERPGAAILFALDREAAPFRARNPGVTTVVHGVGRENARFAADLIADGVKPRLIIAAGFCGALAPHLKVGDIVTSPHILTVDHLVGDPAEKHRLHEVHGADAVDMESSAIEEVCRAKGIAFLAVRAVSDAAETTLSPELLRLLSGGKVSVWKAMKALARKPSMLGEFRRLARDTNQAAEKLADYLVNLAAIQPPHSPASSEPPSPS